MGCSMGCFKASDLYLIRYIHSNLEKLLTNVMKQELSHLTWMGIKPYIPKCISSKMPLSCSSHLDLGNLPMMQDPRVAKDS